MARVEAAEPKPILEAMASFASAPPSSTPRPARGVEQSTRQLKRGDLLLPWTQKIVSCC